MQLVLKEKVKCVRGQIKCEGGKIKDSGGEMNGTNAKEDLQRLHVKEELK